MSKFIYIILIVNIIITQNSEFNISSISVSGNLITADQDIINFSGLSNKNSVSVIDIQNSIKRLWLLNKFEDIQIEMNESYKGIDLIINVIEYPRLNKIEFHGNYFDFKLFKFKKSKNKLEELINFNNGDILSLQKINECINILKEDFISRHYHDVEISYNIENSKIDNRKNILFNINAGEKSKIEDITIILNDKELEKTNFFLNSISNLKSRLFKKPQKLTKQNILKQLDGIKAWNWYTPWKGNYNQSKLNEMEINLVDFYKSKGYLDFYIKKYEIVNKNQLLIHVDTGKQYYIHDINFTGNYIFNDSTLKSKLNFSNGDIFSGMSFDISNMNINTLYRDKGYLFSQIIPSLIPISEDSLKINFSINENSIVKVNQIIIKGNNKTEENIIRRDIDISPGEYFSQSAVMESARRLFMLNYFENIIPDVKRINESEVDLIFEVIEKSSGQLNFSAGYSGLNGFTGGGGFSFPNFLGKGQNISFNYNRGLSSNQQSNIPINNLSQEVKSNQQISFSFVGPRLFDTSNLIGISLNYTERGQSTTYSMPFDSKSYGGGIRLGRRFDWPDKFFKGTWMVNGSKRKYYSSDESNLISYYSSSIQDYIIFEDNQYIFSTSGISMKQSITRDNRDHPEFPTKGSHFNWTFTFSGGFLGGDEDYYKNELGFKWYNKIVEKLVIHQNFKFGLLNSIEVSSGRSVIPPSARFLMGGTGIPYGEMLRGYSDNMIGPLGSSFPKGGNVMLKYSIELRYLISENPNLYILTFMDAGNVWDDINMVDPFSLRRSVGIGARVMMPMIGMIGYDIAYGFDPSVQEYLSGNNNAHGWEYHFIFGMPIY